MISPPIHRALRVETGWTGGQYSLFRFIFGAYLCIHFVQLAPWGTELFSNAGVLPDAAASPLAHAFPNILTIYDPPWFVTALLVAGAAAAVLFAVGWHDRIAAVILWYLWACLFGRNPLTSNPGLPYVGLMLLAHLLIPPAPYGSLAARNRTDPAGGWFMPPVVFGVVWVLMAVGYSYSGLTKLASPSWLDGSAVRHVLENPLARPIALRDMLLALPAPALSVLTWGALALEIGFAPLSLFRRLRPWLWLAGLSMHVSLLVLLDFADLSLGMVMLHLFTFNPAWVPARATRGAPTIFYDGECGLCHGWVRFVLAEDGRAVFRFAPLQGEAFARVVPDTVRSTLPDSIVLCCDGGTVLIRSAAIIEILRGLGGVWRVLAELMRVFPSALRDAVYDVVARARKRIFRKPDDACPVLPSSLRARFMV